MNALNRVLVVEDDPGGQEITRTILQHYDIAVDVAGTAEDALTLLKQNTYDLAVIDLALPGMDGWGLLRHIRAGSATAHLPCVAVTAFHTPRVEVEAEERGFDAYMQKPINIKLFVGHLQRLVGVV